jgi:FkbH-like protein
MSDPSGVRDIDAIELEWRAVVDEWAATDDYFVLRRVGRRAETLAERPEIARRLAPVRVAVVSDATVDLLLPLVRAGLIVAGLRPTIYVAPYGQIAASLLDADGAMTAFRPQIVIVANTTPNLPGWPALDASTSDVERCIDDVCKALLGPCDVFHQRTGAELILGTYHSPPSRVAGHLGAKLPGDAVNFVRRLNVALGDQAPRHVHLFDVAWLAERAGVDRWFDQHYWFEAKQLVSLACAAEYCRGLTAVVGAVLGRARKCLVVDLDNTLWGGVIGDDGLGGIRLGQGSAVGEAFSAFQAYLKGLSRRGVLLAVCSKNEERIAQTPFTEHPDMLLALDDFVSFKANWALKSDNLRVIARELDLPLEALVFVDDNPAERAEVAQNVPEVAVVQLPDDPALYVRALEDARLFETVTLTVEDAGRTAAYQARRQSLEARERMTDVGAYLASLQMHATVGPFDEVSLERITQLINKTNQFNLTTPRLVLAETRRLMMDRSTVTCAVRLRDRFADHGLIAVAFAHLSSDRSLVIDACLMSCRVLGRGVERLVYNYLLEAARANDAVQIVGTYLPTDRNALVKDYYASLGFRRLESDGPGEQWWLATEDAHPAETFITVEVRS